MNRNEIIKAVLAERYRQNEKWGFPQNNTFSEWAGILAEEFGETSKELNNLNFGCGDIKRLKTEAVQLAAVAFAILEQLETAALISELWGTFRERA